LKEIINIFLFVLKFQIRFISKSSKLKMAEFSKKIKEKKMLIIEDYYQKVNECEQFWERDTKSAVKIQTCFRGYRRRIAYNKWK